MAGARGQLDELYVRMSSFNSNYRIEKSETDKQDETSNANIGTAFLLQICRLLTPAELMGDGPKSASEVLKPYKNVKLNINSPIIRATLSDSKIEKNIVRNKRKFYLLLFFTRS